jgi:hypothetical protein
MSPLAVAPSTRLAPDRRAPCRRRLTFPDRGTTPRQEEGPGPLHLLNDISVSRGRTKTGVGWRCTRSDHASKAIGPGPSGARPSGSWTTGMVSGAGYTAKPVAARFSTPYCRYIASFSSTRSEVYGVASMCFVASATMPARSASAFPRAMAASTSRPAHSLGRYDAVPAGVASGTTR